MLITTTPNLTFEEYLTYDDGADTRYELVEGHLISMTPPKIRHQLIVRFLELLFEAEIKRKNLPWVTLHNVGVRTGLRTSRCPDLCVTTIAQTEAIKDLSGVFETSPLLVVEAVSSSSIQDDYITKRDEYQATGIPEYWVIYAINEDPRITIYTLKNEAYDPQVFRNEQQLISSTFSELQMNASQILNA
ncbi:Uma2 family endonuclease [Synechococcus sp. PCC 6312]|uniref:Uma2 family endonuclease n=1 Tax=Synechococcus sp. (strain ATCC 27167 / PCC 6312) TaxID=195253 RepID=UPI00029F12F0|nr:Uma2 family endonuclease [Synechococcus sp. PCC 6312]AFY60005.1 hypothetical protein Syn6312_0790 [Synechococcus sp. PCC 6312]